MRHIPAHRRRSLQLIVLLAGPILVGLYALVAHASAHFPRASGAIQLPDLRIFVPVDRISIGLDPNSGHRDLRFTHITADVGAGPFEIDPHFNAGTGISTFTQAIYRSAGAGQWTYDHSVAVAAAGVWHPPSDYAFPLTRFVLDSLHPDGTIASTVAVSPKTDYCITGDTQLSGIPNTPDQTFIPQENCSDPTKPLGWSVGWGDEYDQTDAGQPIDLSGAPSGRYLLRATVDPEHVLTESSTANDVTDTVLNIAGDSVSVVSQSLAGVPLPRASLTSPAPGSTLGGVVGLSGSVLPAAGSAVRTVQFLLDGQPLGTALHRGPYRERWNTASVHPGRHYLSLRVTDLDGTMNSAPVVAVRIVHAPALRVSGGWHRGLLSLTVGGIPRGGQLRAALTAGGRIRSKTTRSGRLRLRTPRPSRIALALRVNGQRIGAPVTFGLGDRPSVHLNSPVPHLGLSGVVPVSASASDVIGVRQVSFSIDGRRLGRAVLRAPYLVHLDTRHLRRGYHRLRVTALNGLGHRTTVTRRIRVENPAPPMTCFVMQARSSALGRGSVSSGPVHTVVAGETLLALVGADGPAAQRQSATVSGGGLTWQLAARANRSAGDSEIWEAVARRATHIPSITATLSLSGYNVSLTVVAMEGADGVGATARASAPSGAPHLDLRTVARTSLVFATGNDWDSATPRRLPVGWQMLNQRLVTSTGDTFWSQYTNQPTGRAGSRIAVSDLAPINDRWNLAAVELVNSGG